MRIKTCVILSSIIFSSSAGFTADKYGKGILGGCRIIRLTDLTAGQFEVLDIKPAKRICYSTKDSSVGSQIGPGCFVHMRRISKVAADLDSDQDLTAFYEDADCKFTVGQNVNQQLSSYCCSAAKPIECGSEQKEKNFCFNEKVFHKSPSFDSSLSRLRGEDRAFLKRKATDRKIRQKDNLAK